jgi:hypothetical protein
MRKISLIAFAVLAVASTSAHATSRGLTLASADAVPAVQSTTPAVQQAPAAPAAPATTILQTTNPQAQMVLKQLQAHGLIKAQPAAATAPASSATVVTLPASGQPAQVQTQTVQSQPVQAPVAQTQTVATQPVATAPQQSVTPAAAAPTTPAAAIAKPVVHASNHHETDEQKARRIAARYGIHW